MSEYIDKQELLVKAKEHQDNVFGIPLIISEIENAKAVEIVKCKECRMADEDIMVAGYFYCNENRMTHNPDHFCSYGERKEE